MKVTVGKAGSVPSWELSVFSMGDGEGKPLTIIKDDAVFHYVGIGWIKMRPAIQADADEFPVVIYPGKGRPQQIIV